MNQPSSGRFWPVLAIVLACATVATTADWPDWRGPGRRGYSPDVPQSLPAQLTTVWQVAMNHPTMSGVSASGSHIIVADRNLPDTHDLWHCLAADTGRRLWSVSYRAEGDLEYGSAPRAAPVVQDGWVYLLGAFGHLTCARLSDGHVLWSRHLPSDYPAIPPRWGYCGTPLVAGDVLVVDAGAWKDAALVGLDLGTGEERWRSPGDESNYCSYILGNVRGRPQIIGRDQSALRGRDPATGKELWSVLLMEEGMDAGPTPVLHEGRLIVCDSDGTWDYAFTADGVLLPETIHDSEALAPETHTPVVVGTLLVGASEAGTVHGLALDDGLKEVFVVEDDAFASYACVVAGQDRVLFLTNQDPGAAELVLIEIEKRTARISARLRVLPEGSEERWGWSHPALSGSRLFLRTEASLRCIQIGEE